ncbi:hypothetical protein ACFQ2M_33770 [Kitasatospora saccharophila]
MPTWAERPWIAENAARFPEVLAAAGVPVPAGLAAELAAGGAAGGAAYPAFTPGDTCPDNNLLTPDGLRLLDFEAACFQSVFLTAAYCRMPFSSCWCVFELPPDVARQTEDVYRAKAVLIHPELADDACWAAGMRDAVAVWTVNATVLLLPRAAEDGPMHPTRRPVPTRHQLLRHRWEAAARLTGRPALAAAFEGLLREVAARW